MKTSNLSLFIFIGLAAGIITGCVFPQFGQMLHPLALIFLNMIKMIIAPLLFSVVVTGIASHGNIRVLGKLGIKTFIYFSITTILALIIGLSCGLIFEPGSGIDINNDLDVDAVSNLVKENNSIYHSSFLINIFPTSVIKAMAEGNLLQIVVFSIFFALSICAAGEKGKPILDLISSLSEIMFKFTQMVMNFAPIGVFGAMAYTISENGPLIILNCIKIIAVLYFALIIFLLIVLTLVCKITGISLISFLRAIREPSMLAFTTASSEAALPQAMKIMENYGVPKKIVGFVMPTGYTFNLDGSTLYLAVAMLFAMQIVNIKISFHDILFIMFTLMLTSKGIAGVPRVSFVVLAGTLANFGYPLTGAAILFGIDQILDMGRTIVNFIGNCAASVVVAKWENEFNYTKNDEFNKQFLKKNKSIPSVIENAILKKIDIEEHSKFEV